MKRNKIVRIILAIVSIIAVIVLECISPSKFIFVKSILLLFNFVLVLTLTKGEKYNALRILLLTILYLGIFSWFLPASAFQTELSKENVALFVKKNYLCIWF